MCNSESPSAINIKTTTRNNGTQQTTTNPVTSSQSYRNVLLNSIDHRSQETHQTEHQLNEESFSTADLFKIFTNAIQDIKSCRTKLDQIQVFANLIKSCSKQMKGLRLLQWNAQSATTQSVITQIDLLLND